MKTKLLISVLLCSLFFFSSCNKENNQSPNNQVLISFETKYPNAQRVTWESKDGYNVAYFLNGANDAEAWYDESGNWLLTQTEAPLNSLPDAVSESFKNGKYGTWKIDSSYKLERDQTPEPIYIIDVEQGDNDVSLHYANEGTLIRIITDTEGNNPIIPITIPQAIMEYIQTNYAGAILLDYDREPGGFEVDIIHDYMYIQLFFNTANVWISSSWVTEKPFVPEVVMDAFYNSSYASYELEKIRQITKPEGAFYSFEVESNTEDLLLTFNLTGVLLSVVKE